MKAPITTRREEALMDQVCRVLALSLFVLLQHPAADDRAIHIAPCVDADALRPTVLGHRRLDVLDEIFDRAVFRAADPDPLLPARVVRAPRFRIGDIDAVVARDVDPAGPAELLPLIDEAPVLIEDLDSVVRAVADKHPSLRIDGNRVRGVELARARPR